MHTDFFRWLEQHKGRQYDLHSEHLNPAFVKMLRTIGFDKDYVRGEGALHRLNFGVFGQMIIIPLLQKHHASRRSRGITQR